MAAGESTEYVVYPVEEAPQERYGPRVYTGEERWATVFEVVYLARDWHRRSKEPVPITARKREWEFTEVTWPSGQTGRVGIEADTVLGTGVVGADGNGITQAMNDLFGAVIVPELDGRWMPIGQLGPGDAITGYSTDIGHRTPVMVESVIASDRHPGMVVLWDAQGQTVRWANEWVRVGGYWKEQP